MPQVYLGLKRLASFGLQVQLSFAKLETFDSVEKYTAINRKSLRFKTNTIKQTVMFLT